MGWDRESSISLPLVYGLCYVLLFTCKSFRMSTLILFEAWYQGGSPAELLKVGFASRAAGSSEGSYARKAMRIT